MKWNHIHLLTLICVLLLTCNGLHADETCSPDYPDQFPFYAEDECVDVTPLVWDHENSATILANNSSGTIYVTGGTLPVTVQVRGNGFWLDSEHTILDGVVNGESIEIFADATACGSADITVTDGCNSVGGSLRCTVGKWVQIGWSVGGDMHCWGALYGSPSEIIEQGKKYVYAGAHIGESGMVSGYECTNIQSFCMINPSVCEESETVCLQGDAPPTPYPGGFFWLANGVYGQGYRSHLCVDGLPSGTVLKYDSVLVDIYEWECN